MTDYQRLSRFLAILVLALQVIGSCNGSDVKTPASERQATTLTGPLDVELGYMRSDIEEHENMYDDKTRKLLLDRVNPVKTTVQPIEGTVARMDANLLRSLDAAEGKRWAILQYPDNLTSDWQNTSAWRGAWRRMLQNQVQAELDQIDKDKPYTRIAIAVDSVVRETNPEKKDSQFGSVPLAHVDFSMRDKTLEAMVSPFADMWIPKIEAAMQRVPGHEGFDSKDIFDEYELDRAINVWTLLSKKLTGAPIAMCDLDSTNRGTQFREYTAMRRIGVKEGNEGRVEKFKAVALVADGGEGNRWHYYRSGMSLGESFIFDSFETPHSALVAGDEKRQSVEVRIIVIKRRALAAIVQDEATRDLPQHEE